MNVKKTIMAILCLLIFTLLMIVLYPLYLTHAHSEEFSNLEQLGCNYMHPWESDPDFRVLSYSKKYATVYYYSPTGGEKIKFAKTESGWTYYETLSTWSSSGSADDYFVWPYYKNWVI